MRSRLHSRPTLSSCQTALVCAGLVVLQGCARDDSGTTPYPDGTGNFRMRVESATTMRIDSLLVSPGRLDVVMTADAPMVPGRDYESLAVVARDAWPLLPVSITPDTLLFHLRHVAGQPGTFERSSYFYYRALLQERMP